MEARWRRSLGVVEAGPLRRPLTGSPPCFHTLLSTFSVFPLLLPLAGAFGTSGLPVGMKLIVCSGMASSGSCSFLIVRLEEKPPQGPATSRQNPLLPS